MKFEFILSLLGGAAAAFIALAIGVFTVEQKPLVFIFGAVAANSCYLFLRDSKV